MIRPAPEFTPLPCTPLFRSLVSFFWGNAAYRVFRDNLVVGQVPLAWTVALIPGPTAVQGTAEPEGETLRGPITGQQCLCYRKLVEDRKSTRLNSSHVVISYVVFCLKKKSFILFRSLFRSYCLFLLYSSFDFAYSSTRPS